MKWKYNVIFLFMLFSLALPEKLNAQYCLDFKYDKSGNRTEVYAHNCGFEYKELSREMGDEEISVEIESEGLLVYPNPNDGCFVVCLENDDIENASYQIFSTTGMLVQNGKCSMNHKINITDNPAGVYLLRIIKGDSEYSCVVVKL